MDVDPYIKLYHMFVEVNWEVNISNALCDKYTALAIGQDPKQDLSAEAPALLNKTIIMIHKEVFDPLFSVHLRKKGRVSKQKLNQALPV